MNRQQLERSLKCQYLIAALLLVLGVSALVFWVIFAQVTQAAIASGLLEPSQGTRPVQHPRGGVIAQLWVEEGDLVKRGDLLVTFNDAEIQAELARLNNRYLQARVTMHRLTLELKNEIWSDPDVAGGEVLESALLIQRQLFASRQRAHQVQGEILRTKSAELEDEREGLVQERSGTRLQLDIISERISALADLTAKRMISQTDQLNLMGREAEYKGRAGQLDAQIARVNQRQSEARLRLEMLERDRTAALSVEIEEQQRLSTELRDQIRIQQVRLAETALYAEQDGLVSQMSVSIRGEVVAAGQAIMRLVPTDEPLVVTASVNLDDIDLVSEGADVLVRLGAYSQRVYPPLPARVTRISADRLHFSGGEGFYEVRVELLDTSAVPMLYPGMRAELTIVSQKQPVWRYLLSPMMSRFERALHEA